MLLFSLLLHKQLCCIYHTHTATNFPSNHFHEKFREIEFRFSPSRIWHKYQVNIFIYSPKENCVMKKNVLNQHSRNRGCHSKYRGGRYRFASVVVFVFPKLKVLTSPSFMVVKAILCVCIVLFITYLPNTTYMYIVFSNSISLICITTNSGLIFIINKCCMLCYL